MGCMNEYSMQRKLRHVHWNDRGAIASKTGATENSVALPTKLAKGIADAKRARKAATAAIDEVTGDGVGKHAEATRVLRDKVAAADDYLLGEERLAEAAKHEAAADALLAEIREDADTLDAKLDALAYHRGVRARLLDSNPKKRGANVNVKRHRPGGGNSVAVMLGVAVREDVPLVGHLAAQRLRRGQDAVALDGSPVAAGSPYRTVYKWAEPGVPYLGLENA